MKTLKSIAIAIFAFCVTALGACSQDAKADSDAAKGETNEVATKAKGNVNSEYTVIDFNATWCGPCKQFAPTFEKIGDKYASQAQFLSVDVDENPQMAIQYNVQAIPTVVILKGDKVVAQEVGLLSEEQFETMVRDALK